MSFFIDFFNELKVDKFDKDVIFTFVLSKGLSIVGKFKIDSFDNKKVVLIIDKKIVDIEGFDLKLNNVSNGEILIEGKIQKISLEVENVKWN